jgi:uncharacterized Zn finger protein (UPF0148 family)
MTKKRICKLCGREFVPAKTGDRYCPGICSMTAGLIKPQKAKSPKPPSKDAMRAGSQSMETRFSRVMAMFAAPIDARWKFARDFTPEEQEFSRKIAKRMIAEERRIDYDAAYGVWGSGFDGDDDGDGQKTGKAVFEEDILGDSDDGSI